MKDSLIILYRKILAVIELVKTCENGPVMVQYGCTSLWVVWFAESLPSGKSILMSSTDGDVIVKHIVTQTCKNAFFCVPLTMGAQSFRVQILA